MFMFDGVLRSCVDYKIVRGVGLRCAEYQNGKKHPSCPKPAKLKGGGRSQNYLRPGPANCAPGVKAKGKRAKRKSQRKSRR